MSPTRKKVRIPIRFLALLPFILILAAAGIFVLSGGSVSVEDILNYTPDNPVLAAIVLILLSSLKSLTVFFPIVALLVAGGIMFSTPAALLVNSLAVAACISTPYWLGRLAGADLVDRIFERYPKLGQLKEFQQKNDFFFSYIARIVGILPCDIVSLYMGAARIPYRAYITGGMLGFIPCILTSTLIGTSINDPSSPLFIFSVASNILLSVGSSGIYWLWQRRKGKREDILS